MKKIINKLLLAGTGLLAVISCGEPENVIYDVFDGLEHGAIMRVLNHPSKNFNVFDASQPWTIEVEEQDERNGKLFKELNVYMALIDQNDDGVDNNTAEGLVKTIPASSFSESANGLPSTSVSVTLTEAVTGLGLSAGEYLGGDKFTIRFEVVLTDGRTFSAADGSGTLQGSYFASPYQWEATILCVPAAPISGTYVLNLNDSYGDGWQGSAIRVTIDGTPTDFAIPDYWAGGCSGVGNADCHDASFNVVVPGGTSTLTWEFVAGSYPGECSYDVIGPNSGIVIASGGPNPPEGTFALNLCFE